MAEDLDETAAAYALGIARGDARAAIEARLGREPALQAEVDLWQVKLAAIDITAPPGTPPVGLFDRIIAAIESGQELLPGTLTRRAGTGSWAEMARGVWYTVLFDDPVTKRRSILIRAEPGAIYESHSHDEGYEECLVLEGDLTIGDLKLYPGDFHVAAKGSMHPAATTVSGCLLYLSGPI